MTLRTIAALGFAASISAINLPAIVLVAAVVVAVAMIDQLLLLLLLLLLLSWLFSSIGRFVSSVVQSINQPISKKCQRFFNAFVVESLMFCVVGCHKSAVIVKIVLKLYVGDV